MASRAVTQAGGAAVNADGLHIPPMKDMQHHIVAALCNLYRHDQELLDVNANERSITHKLAEYLQREFPYWHVDYEYNRQGFDKKKLLVEFTDSPAVDDTEASTVFPDIIVHRRGIKQNLLVVEVKKDCGTKDTRDCEKLEAFGRDEKYEYRYGLFLRIGKRGCSEAKVFVQGTEKPDESGNLKELIRARLQELGYGNSR